MTHRARRTRAVMAAILLAVAQTSSGPLAAQSGVVPLSPDAWTATDSIRSVSYLGRPALYINRGVALVRGAAMENGTLDLDVAASDTTNFLGVAFRATSPRFSNVVFLRPGASGTEEAVQYGPAFNSLGVAWQVYHGDGANAVAEIPRNRWVHVRVELDGPVARLFVDTATTPTLVVPRLVTSGGAGLGVWTGAFGRGAYFSNIRYAASPRSSADTAVPAPPPGTMLDWEISDAIEAADFTPTALPDLGRLTWQRVQAEPEGFVLINRYREAPVGGVPRDSTGAVLTDSVMTGKIADSRIVYARTTITAAQGRDPPHAVRLQQWRRHLPQRPAARLRDESRRAEGHRGHGQSGRRGLPAAQAGQESGGLRRHRVHRGMGVLREARSAGRGAGLRADEPAVALIHAGAIVQEASDDEPCRRAARSSLPSASLPSGRARRCGARRRACPPSCPPSPKS